MKGAAIVSGSRSLVASRQRPDDLEGDEEDHNPLAHVPVMRRGLLRAQELGDAREELQSARDSRAVQALHHDWRAN